MIPNDSKTTLRLIVEVSLDLLPIGTVAPPRGRESGMTSPEDTRNTVMGVTRTGLAWLVIVVALGMSVFGCGPQESESPVVVIVNDRPLTLSEFEYRWSELSPSTRARYEQEGSKRKFLDDLISRELIMQEARKRGLAKSPTIRHRTQRFTEQLLLDEVMRDAVKAKVEATQEELDAYYIAQGAILPAPDLIEVSQIVSTNIYASKDIRRMLAEGIGFSGLAKRYSTDKASRENGGARGLYKKGDAPEEVEKVIYKLRPGRTSDPIKTDSGYYLVRVTSRKPGNTKAILASRERLKQEFLAQKRQMHIKAFLAKLKDSAAIRIQEGSKYVANTPAKGLETSSP